MTQLAAHRLEKVDNPERELTRNDGANTLCSCTADLTVGISRRAKDYGSVAKRNATNSAKARGERNAA
jgi:hypothetical protein